MTDELQYNKNDAIAATLTGVQPRVVRILRRMITRFSLAFELVRDMTVEIMQNGEAHNVVCARHLCKAIQLMDGEDQST